MRDLNITGAVLLALIFATASVPLVLAFRDSPPASNWHVTKASVWGGK